MLRDPDCIFCRIVAVELPSVVVYQGDLLIAFLDINPLADGHLLVVPRDHYATLSDVPADVCASICALLPMLGRTLLSVTGAAGFNVLQNNGAVAGQAVNHVHFHLIPRSDGDELGYRWNPSTYPDGRTDELAAAYQQALSK